MRNYSSKKAKKGKLAFRTPSRFITRAKRRVEKNKCSSTTANIKKLLFSRRKRNTLEFLVSKSGL